VSAAHLPLPPEAVALLDFARASRVAHGFAHLDAHGEPDPAKPLELWINCRMTHSFALGAIAGVEGCAELAAHGTAALAGVFADDDHPGWHSAVGWDGLPVPGEKEAYAHAFVVLAASSAVAAGIAGGEALLALALDAQERFWWREDDGMVVDRYDRAMRVVDPYRGINATMHTVEAYLAAAGVTGDDRWLDRALRMTERAMGFARAHAWRLPEHYDEQWRPVLDYNRDRPADPFRPFGATPGHWMEWARLALHIRAELGLRGRAAPSWLLEDAVALFDAALWEGWDVDGAPGFVYTVDWEGAPVVRQRMHWVVCEGIGAAVALEKATGEDRFADAAAVFWEYVGRYVIERPGAWRHELSPRNEPAGDTWPGKPDVYHALQAVLLPGLPLAPAFAPALAAQRARG